LRYLVVGCGGTGSHLVPPLITYLSSHSNDWLLGLMDGDDVEEKNFDRQLFEPSALNENKATALRKAYPHIKNIAAIPNYLSKDNIADTIQENSVVLICVDNFPVRALIEDHCLTLDNVVVINGGNEIDTGSCQIWVRKDGVNVTPKLSFLHPEIRQPGVDRAEMSCQQIAELPGGEQLITTNMSSALWMLIALMSFHNDTISYTELQFNLNAPNKSYAVDQREVPGWA